jgi:isocitrate/isopropylmalate dehydrogenase
MKQFSIAVIPGDGIGSEVTAAALRVVEAAMDTQRFNSETR